MTPKETIEKFATKDALAFLSNLLGHPIQAFVLGCMVAAGIGGWAVWEDRNIILRRLLAPSNSLNLESFNSSLVLNKLEGRVLVIWEVDAASNLRRLRRFESRTFGRFKDLENNEVGPLFTDKTRENEFMRRIISGETVCSELDPTSRIGLLMQQNGITYICRAPISGPAGTVLAYMTVGYEFIPSDENHKILLGEMTAAIKELNRAAQN